MGCCFSYGKVADELVVSLPIRLIQGVNLFKIGAFSSFLHDFTASFSHLLVGCLYDEMSVFGMVKKAFCSARDLDPA